MADYDKLLQVPRGTKARLEQIKLDLLANTIVYATDTKELGIKLANGNIEYFMNATDINARVDTLKTDNAYFNYASSIYGYKYSLFLNAWEHSLTVDPLDISSAQYPNGEIEGVIIPEGVTSIGNNAFHTLSSNNQPLVIPNTVTTIGNGAFSYWSANNQPLVIPDSVTNIETGSFQYWTANNQPLVIPNSVTTIGNYAFRYWSSNNHPLIIPNSVTSIGQYAFEGWSFVPYVEIQAITPPTLVNADAFYNQDNAQIYVPDESVDDYKEAINWDMLANRIFPMSDKPDLGDLDENKLNKIWTDITELTTIHLTDILVFNRDSNVYKTTIANLLAKVGNEIFEVVSVLPITGEVNKIYLVPSSDPKTQNALDEFIWVSNAWELIGSVSMDLSNYFNKTEINSMLGGKQDKLVAGENITINPTTNVISASGGGDGIDLNMLGYMNYAADIFYRGGRQSLFADAWESSLTVDPLEISADSVPPNSRGEAQYPNGATEGVIIPQGVTSIGDYAFSEWASNNKPLVIPNSVTSIGERAFYYWITNNNPIIIPNSVTSIGKSAFFWWLLVPYIEIHSLTPPTLGDYSAFTNQSNTPIYVPDESLDDYKTATNWVEFADRIFSINDKVGAIDDVESALGDIESSLGDIESALDAILGV